VIRLRRKRLAAHATCMREGRNAYNILVRKPEAKRLLGRRRHKWENNIKVNHKELVLRIVSTVNMVTDLPVL
jgi:hypothetical protein